MCSILRYLSRITLVILISVFSTISMVASPIVEGDDPSLYISFDNCASFGGGSNADYSEFTPVTIQNSDCSELSLVGGYVYRNNNQVNTHSCAPGRNNTSAMCISAMDQCNYDIQSDLDLKFDVQVIPGNDGTGRISEVSFYSRAPEQFQFLEGPTGPNNYPTLYTLRVVVNGSEIYRAEDMPLTDDWQLQTYDFASNPGFEVTDTTIFNFEILPYCLAGIPSPIQAWDIEDLTITAACAIVDGGLISTQDATFICSKPGSNSIINTEVTGAIGDSSVWVVMNSAGMIQTISQIPSFDFAPLDAGLYVIYHLAYQTEIQGLSEGEIFDDLTGCFGVSNAIGIVHQKVAGGSMLTSAMENSISFCTGDGQADIINPVIVNQIGSFTSYIVTDLDSMVLDVSKDPDFDFEGSASGTCLYFALAHESFNSGLREGDFLADLEDCFDLSTPITVTRNFVDGGIINSDGMTSLTVCVENMASVNGEVAGDSGTQAAWIITDMTGLILNLPLGPPFNLSEIEEEECQIWHVSFHGQFNLTEGINLDELEGCFDLSNPINITKTNVQGGTLTLEGGGDALTICADDGISDAFNIMLLNALGDTSLWVVTDSANVILAFPSSPPFDLEGSGPGICQLYRLSHNGGISGLSIGTDLDSIGGCFALSNPIIITRLTGTDCPQSCNVEGGFIDLFGNNFCVGDGEEDLLEGDVINAEGTFSSFILSTTDSTVIFVTDTLLLDIDFLDGGEYLVWHLSSDILFEPDSTVIQIQDIDLACFDLSEPANLTTVFNNAGMVSLIDGDVFTAICLSDTLSDILEFMHSSIATNSYQFVVTDTSQIILGLPDSTLVDFAGTMPGVCRVYGVSYTGSFLPVVGDTLGNEPLTGFCFDISDNFVTVVRDTVDGACAIELCEVDGGSIDLFDNEVCVGDGVPDLVDGDVFGAEGNYLTFVLTDSDSIILAVPDTLPIDLDGSGEGVCLFWHLAANDTISLTPGQHIASISACHDLSAPASVNRIDNNAGVVSLTSLDTSITVCVSDTLSDILEFTTTSMSTNEYQFVITDTSGLIIGLPDSTLVNFGNAGVGVCHVYGISYTGSLPLMVGDIIFNAPTTNECYDLSDNFVEVIRVEGADCPDDCVVDGGQLELFTSSVCVGDGVPDLVDGQVSGQVGDYFTFLITGVDSLILGISPDLPINFESAGPGACLLWHLAASDSIPINMGDNVSAITGCFDLAEPQQVTRIENNAGLVSLDGGATLIEVCTGDGAADILSFENSSGSGNSYQYVITDEMNMILALPPGNMFDFENAGVGTCRVYGVSYTGMFLPMVGDSLEVVPDTDSCFDISNNFIEVVRVDSGPNCVTTAPALSIVVNRVSEWFQVFDIKNVSQDTIDVSDYWICRGPGMYNRIGDVIVECGNGLNMAPGDIIGLNISLDNSDGELGIYTTNEFTNPDAMIHYVEWGSTGHVRSSVAVAAGLWTTGDFVPAITPQGSAYFDGDGISSADWIEGGSAWCASIPAIVFNRVGNSGQIIDIKNVTNNTINVADYWICELGNYFQIRDLVIECGGDTILDPGEILGLNINVADADGELGLYISNQFAFPSEIIDYVEWGSTGHLRSGVAVAAGIWTTGDFVPAITPGMSIYYDDEGNSSSDWTESATNFCSDSSPLTGGEEILFNIYPIPADDYIQMQVLKVPDTEGELMLFDSYGNLLINKHISFEKEGDLKITLPDLSPGIYFARLRSSTQIKTNKFMISR